MLMGILQNDQITVIGNCPFEAIEYGEITRDREKYNILHYVKMEYLK